MGVIVHWGVYSVPAYDSVASARQRFIQNGSEWYAWRLTMTANSYRPVSGWREAQAYHAKQYGAATPYRALADKMTAKAWLETDEADRWMRLFREAGASYVVLTAKHHDGFCLWPTRTSTFHSGAVGPRCDLLQQFKAAAQRNGLAFGLYYSWSEFGVAASKAYMDTTVVPQIDELIAYNPALVWFDGDWPCSSQYCQKVMDACCAKLRSRLPGVQINDRVGHKQRRRADPNFLGSSFTYRVYADRAIPARKPAVPWEHVNTIGYSWGRNRTQTEADHKTAQQLAALRERVRALGGRFLINVGPNADGTLCPIESARLKALAALTPTTATTATTTTTTQPPSPP